MITVWLGELSVFIQVLIQEIESLQSQLFRHQGSVHYLATDKKSFNACPLYGHKVLVNHNTL